ncbi:MAG: ATP phosphoribosyltransferase [Chloroflexi bacterium]|nr:ATP phosphoribosyltransferase [Chloroflexota bacterium]
MLNGTGSGVRREPLRLAVPSDGQLYESTLGFFQSCGIPIERASSRRYTASLGGVPGVAVLFQRTADIPRDVDDGSADLGVVGMDRFLEYRREGGDAAVILDSLRFGRCDLVVAVPEPWIDVTTMADMADLAAELHAAGRELRVATKYPRLTRSFFTARGVNFFSLVQASGTLEVAPAMGFADAIVDISATGATLRENRLKTLEDGAILTSHACLVGNLRQLRSETPKLQITRAILERVEARLRAEGYYRITANIQGESPEAVAAHLLTRPEVAGVQGPTIAPVHSKEGGRWYAVTVLVGKERMLDAVEHLRRLGGNGITVMQPSYLFQTECEGYRRLVERLGKE